MKDKYITREPTTSTNVVILSNTIFNEFIKSDCAFRLILLVLRMPDNFKFKREWGADMMSHDLKTIDTALDELEAKGFLTKIKISAKDVKYFWYENPKLNADFIAGKTRKKIKDIKPKTKTKRRTSSKDQVLDDILIKATSSLRKVQTILLNVSQHRELLTDIYDVEAIIEQLEAKLLDKGDTDQDDQDEQILKVV